MTMTKQQILAKKPTSNPLLNLGGYTQKLESKLEYIRSINVSIQRNQLDMITAITLHLIPIEIKIPEKTIEIMPIEFDTIEELLNLTSKSINKVNKRWQDKTIAIRSQLTLFD